MRWVITLVIVGVILYLLSHQRKDSGMTPLTLQEQSWGPNKNRINCDTMETDHPLPDVDPITRARILELLKKACTEPIR